MLHTISYVPLPESKLVERVSPTKFKTTNSLKTKIRIESHSAFANRLILAMFGGASLIAPLLIMTLHPGLTTSHITTCVSTFLFALVLAIGAEETSGKDLLGATAAYAAVLVVFIGTSL